MNLILAAVTLAVNAAAVEVTVYNQDLGLVKETRTFSLDKGLNELKAVDVAARIDPTSVHFKSLTAPDAVTLLEQNFVYDLISGEKLMQKYIGKEIELERYTGQNGDKRETLKGTLLSTEGGRVLRSGGKIYVNPPGSPVLPDLPEGLETKPALIWKVNAKQSGKHETEVSYLTSGLSWTADYVLVVDAKDEAGDLNAWVTLDNQSGAAYKDAKLKLVAGDVHRAPRARPRYEMMAKMSAARGMADEASGFQEKSFFEYHLYTLGRPTTIREREIKQVELATAAGVPVKKTFTYRGAETGWGDFNDYTRSDPNYGLQSTKKVWVMLEMKNSKQNKLGMPMPAGRVRVYKADHEGSLQLVGEDAIDHTPKDEAVKVKLGNAFDIVGERKRVNFRSDSNRRWFEETFEIRLRNHKDGPVVVAAVEPLYRWTGWKIVESSQNWTKKDAQTIQFDVPVAKDGESVVTYTVKYSW